MNINFIPSQYQWNIFAFVQNGEGHGVIEAVAGSGKTTTIVTATQLTSPQAKVAFVAFNKHIADTLSDRAPAHVHTSTLHSLGFANIRCAWGNVQVDSDKLRHILANHKTNGFDSSVIRLVSLCKANLLEPTSTSLNYIADRWDIDVPEEERESIYRLTSTVYRASLEQRQTIDYDDMIHSCATGMVGCQKFDVLFVDECLPYKTPVLLADGSSIPIGEIVENRMEVKVLAYDTSTHEQKACEVWGWHKIPNTKPLIKVRVKWAQRKGTNIIHSFVVCTADHKIWTTSGYIEAGNLKPGMIVQVETSARKSQAYKITSSGRKMLSWLMTEKNKVGLMGNEPPIDWRGERGGNGKPIPVPQELLLTALGNGWISEYAILTRQAGGQKSGYPNCYKVDIANPSLKIAIEVDGNSHKSQERQLADVKKDSCLKTLGWTVYRFDNWKVMSDLDSIVAQFQDCPIPATVVSVEPMSIKEWFVYDITIKDCHNFYANGILVHNCQDLNKAQIEMALRSIKAGGRIIAVGDRWQSVYGFRGADVDAIPNVIKALDASTLPLSICYRCPTSHVALAKELVPQIEACEDAPDGIIEDIEQWKLAERVKPGDLVICRCNAPLVRPALRLISNGIKAVILGRDIGQGLMALLRKVQKQNHTWDLLDTILALGRYVDQEAAKLYASNKAMKAQSLQDRADTIEALADGCNSFSDLEAKIASVFSDDQQGITFSTVHRAKGTEADRVFILQPNLMPHPKASKPWEIQQERNIKYVALTRAKEALYFVQ